MPTEKVQSSVVMPSIAMIWRAISRIAERPEDSVRAGMARLAGRFEIEARDRVASGDDAVVGAAGLRHQHVFVARGFRLDDVAGRGRADFLVAA